MLRPGPATPSFLCVCKGVFPLPLLPRKSRGAIKLMVPYSTRCLIFINRFCFFGGITHRAAIPSLCGTWGSPRRGIWFPGFGLRLLCFFFIHSAIRSWLWAAPGTAVALRCARPLRPGWIRCSWCALGSGGGLLIISTEIVWIMDP